MPGPVARPSEDGDHVSRDVRTGLDVLSLDECLGLLARSPIGRIAVHLAECPPAIFPVNYAVAETTIVFRTDTSSILHRAHQHEVAFEIDGIERRYHLGWSVLVVGIVEEVTDHSELAALATLPLGPWVPGAKSHWMRIRPETITGRSIPPLQHGA
jgi:nitroimidazol reductase NimA-like FMN-containing flavoprotein (pyridoxamine 5'-phosphate oxidase superfamily)